LEFLLQLRLLVALFLYLYRDVLSAVTFDKVGTTPASID